MHADTLSPGTQLAGRYRIEDLVGETPRSQTWRALDRVLNRSVSVQVVGGDDDGSEGFLTAARAATAVEDPRFPRVLDAARESGHAYVVREWARGVSLDTVLQQGPLPAQRAVEVVREVADAVASAHRVGVQHGRIDPARIIVKHNGAVRVLGLATDQALHAPVHAPAAPPGATNGTADQTTGPVSEQSDVTALGRLLYACLVARWPGGRDVGLPGAPTEHGRLLRPRQVRAGVDPSVDQVVDRILGTPPRHHDTPLRSAVDVARELAVVSVADAAPGPVDDATTPRGVLPLAPDPAGPPPAIHQVPPPRTGPGAAPVVRAPEPATQRTGARAPVWVGIALLVALGTLLAVLVGRTGSGVLPLTGADPPAATATRAAAPAVGRLDIVGVSDFDPQGTDGGENPDEVAAATDGDPATAWTTSTYFGFSALGNLKHGVGLLVDLGKAHDVSRVDLTLLGGPTSLKLFADPGAKSAPTGVFGLTRVGDTTTDAADPGAPVQTSVAVDPAVSTRWVVVWLTDLPPDGAGNYEGQIAEMAVVG